MLPTGLRICIHFRLITCCYMQVIQIQRIAIISLVLDPFRPSLKMCQRSGRLQPILELVGNWNYLHDQIMLSASSNNTVHERSLYWTVDATHLSTHRILASLLGDVRRRVRGYLGEATESARGHSERTLLSWRFRISCVHRSVWYICNCMSTL